MQQLGPRITILATNVVGHMKPCIKDSISRRFSITMWSTGEIYTQLSSTLVQKSNLNACTPYQRV